MYLCNIRYIHSGLLVRIGCDYFVGHQFLYINVTYSCTCHQFLCMHAGNNYNVTNSCVYMLVITTHVINSCVYIFLYMQIITTHVINPCVYPQIITTYVIISCVYMQIITTYDINSCVYKQIITTHIISSHTYHKFVCIHADYDQIHHQFLCIYAGNNHIRHQFSDNCGGNMKILNDPTAATSQMKSPAALCFYSEPITTRVQYVLHCSPKAYQGTIPGR